MALAYRVGWNALTLRVYNLREEREKTGRNPLSPISIRQHQLYTCKRIAYVAICYDVNPSSLFLLYKNPRMGALDFVSTSCRVT